MTARLSPVEMRKERGKEWERGMERARAIPRKSGSERARAIPWARLTARLTATDLEKGGF
ncbi:MAG: hypothetical protein ACAI44_18780 [Candidatus Sericytochromatia bacterium]